MAECDNNQKSGYRSEQEKNIVRKARVAVGKANDFGPVRERSVQETGNRQPRWSPGTDPRNRASETIPKRIIVRKPRSNVPVVFLQKEADRPQGYLETETIEPEKQTLSTKIEVEHTTNTVEDATIVAEDATIVAEDATIVAEDAMISTSSLRRFALEELPKKSVLREVILLEKGQLTAQEFCDRIRIWLCLLQRDI